MWNVAGATLAKIIYWQYAGVTKTFGSGDTSFTNYATAIKTSDGDILGYDNLSEEFLSKYACEVFGSSGTCVVTVPGLLDRLVELDGIDNIVGIGVFASTHIFRAQTDTYSAIIVAWPAESPVLFVADCILATRISNDLQDLGERVCFGEAILNDSDEVRIDGVPFSDCGKVMIPGSWSVEDTIDFFNQGKKSQHADVTYCTLSDNTIGEHVRGGILYAIQNSKDTVECYKTLVNALMQLDPDLPDMLDVVLKADR